MFKQATIKDVAILASVHASTVSRVLGQCPEVRVRPETRQRIIQAAHQLNYWPNSIARSLKTNKTFTLAMYVPDVGNPVFPEIIKGVERTASEQGYSVLLSHMDDRSIREQVHLRMFLENRVDGLLIATATIQDSVIDGLVQTGFPFMLINRRASETNHYVIVDDIAGAKLAVDYLIRLGHRRIAHLAGPLMFDTALRRLQGYRKSLADHGLDFDNRLVVESDWLSWEAGRLAMRRLLDREMCPTAIFAGNLVQAVGATVFLQRAGLGVPDDISVIALHDAPVAEIVSPPLSVVKMPLYDMGREAVKGLLSLINVGREIGPSILPPLGLVIRKSTAVPKKRS
jgi:LacI family transcriptional regulator